MDKSKEKPPVSIERIEPREITDELRESYLDYAMSVIIARALPDVRDGMKPVQRRILWAMWDTGLLHTAKFRKSANVVGEVMGKYHPHGDSAIYDTLARMAQDFSLRYPLIDGQGNWGSVDGDAPAAMRYTEARLTKISEELLLDIEKETVEWQPNYDSSREEPKYLPAKLPNLLLNGVVGIAVGMATSIPPHNLVEVLDAIMHLAEHPDADTKELMQFIPGPDFPTGGVVYDKKALEEAYATGHGSVTMRAVAEIEERTRSTSSGQAAGGFQIVITEIPYQVNKSDLISKMADLVVSKKVEGVRDIRDESDREGFRIVVELKQDGAPQKVLNQFYSYTELQKNFHFNMLALVDGIQPQVLSLKEILSEYLKHRTVVVRRRTEFDLKKAKERAHILEGLVKALDAIDRVIETIKKSKDKDDARTNLMKKFTLTEIQANAILEMRLQTLAALERHKIEDELKEKKTFITECEIILKSPKKIAEIIKHEAGEMRAAYPSARKTKLIASGLKEFNEEDLIPQEEVIVTLTKDGYIKRMPPTSFRAQKRGGKGLIGIELKEEDQIYDILSANTHDNALFFTDRGRAFQTKVHEIPVASRTAKGKSVHNFLTLSQEEKIAAIVTYSSEEKKSGYLVMATRGGVIKKTALKDFENVRRSGIIALKIKPDDSLRWVRRSIGVDEIIMVTAQGQSIRFKEKDVRQMGRTAAGIHSMRLKKGDIVAGLDIIRSDKKVQGAKLLVVMAHGFGKQTPLKEYKVQHRGGSGIKTAKVTPKTGVVIDARIVGEEMEEVIAFSSKGQAIRSKIGQIRIAGRATQGVKVMNLEEGDSLIGIVCL
ncbi:MAG: DNA gyrase subunit A [Candidatus Jorgensenbacteria bacterium]|nr:DNA gyrase subunit A [Candidatus Jorgensenbacteria bacterium]